MSLDAAWARRWIESSAADIAEQRDYLVDLDRAIGDGDHGENMDRGFKAAVEALGQAQPASVAEVLKTVAKTLMSTVGGAAGPLYGTAFLRASKAAGDGDLDGAGVAAVIAGALDGIQARGKATTGEKTMVDAWTPALEAARAAAESGSDPAAVLEAAATAAEAGAAATEPMRATKGRASYLGERSIGHLDPGAVSTSLILRAAVRAADEAGAPPSPPPSFAGAGLGTSCANASSKRGARAAATSATWSRSSPSWARTEDATAPSTRQVSTKRTRSGSSHMSMTDSTVIVAEPRSVRTMTPLPSPSTAARAASRAVSTRS